MLGAATLNPELGSGFTLRINVSLNQKGKGLRVKLLFKPILRV